MARGRLPQGKQRCHQRVKGHSYMMSTLEGAMAYPNADKKGVGVQNPEKICRRYLSMAPNETYSLSANNPIPFQIYHAPSSHTYKNVFRIRIRKLKLRRQFDCGGITLRTGLLTLTSRYKEFLAFLTFSKPEIVL